MSHTSTIDLLLLLMINFAVHIGASSSFVSSPSMRRFGFSNWTPIRRRRMEEFSTYDHYRTIQNRLRFHRLNKTYQNYHQCNLHLLSDPQSSNLEPDKSSSSSSSSPPPPSFFTSGEREKRINALNEQLSLLGIDCNKLLSAVEKSMTTNGGNDPYYGKSAIKAYKTFVNPKPSKVQTTRNEDIIVASSRCARQIDFLAKRQRSREADWVRHTDNEVKEVANRKLFPLIVLLDNVRSAFNVGSIFRTADACGCSMVITTGITPSPHGRGREKLSKSALNADRIVNSIHFATTMEAINYLRKELPGFQLIGMETTSISKCYTKIEYKGKGMFTENGIMPKFGVVCCLGNEVSGVDTEIIPLLDHIVELPMFGQKNSLNIAACAPVFLYEVLRQWGVMDNQNL